MIYPSKEYHSVSRNRRLFSEIHPVPGQLQTEPLIFYYAAILREKE